MQQSILEFSTQVSCWRAQGWARRKYQKVVVYYKKPPWRNQTFLWKLKFANFQSKDLQLFKIGSKWLNLLAPSNAAIASFRTARLLVHCTLYFATCKRCSSFSKLDLPCFSLSTESKPWQMRKPWRDCLLLQCKVVNHICQVAQATCKLLQLGCKTTSL